MQLHMDLTEKPSNVNGTVIKDGQPVAGVWVMPIRLQVKKYGLMVKTDENGNLSVLIYQMETL